MTTYQTREDVLHDAEVMLLRAQALELSKRVEHISAARDAIVIQSGELSDSPAARPPILTNDDYRWL